MRKVLAVITALVLAAIVFAPAMGYSIKTGEKPAFSFISGQKVDFSITKGVAAHETLPEPILPILPTFSIRSKALPYTFKLGEVAKYSAEFKSSAEMRVLGSQKPKITKNLGKGLITPSWVKADPCKGVTCPEGQTCQEGACVCADGAALCGGACCSANQTCENDTCVSTDPCEGIECPEGQTCQEGACVCAGALCGGACCPANQICENETCVSTDPCEGIECPEGQTCQEGACVCADGAALCGEACCSANQTCENDTCVAMVKKLSIKGMVFDDLDSSGVKDENETGLAGWVIDLIKPDGEAIKTTTAEDGSYVFSDIMPGDYMVVEVLQANWTSVSPMEGRWNVTLMDVDVTGVDFANMKLP